MRTLSHEILSDYSAKATKLESRLRLYKSRVFFKKEDLVDTYAPSWADPVGIPVLPVSQDFKYNLQINKPFTVASRTSLYCGPVDRELVALVSGGLPVATSAASRPSSWSDATQTVIYYVGADISIHKLTVDATLIDAGNANAIVANEVVTEVQDLVAIHAISGTALVYLWVNDGGVSVTYAEKTGDGWSLDTWPLRFMHPTHNFSNYSNDDRFSLNFSGAVVKDGSVFVYYSGVDGNVLGVERKSNGSWSDVFEAMPADLSAFKIANVVLAPNGTIHLVGQFQRVDPEGYFGSSWVYALDLWSYEGRTFSLDRFTMFALGDTSDVENYRLGYRFQMAVKPGTPDVVYYSDLNRYLTANAPYSVSGENAESLVISNDDIIRVDGADTNYTIKIANGNGAYTDNPFFEVGTIIKLDQGSRGNYFQYMDLILTDVAVSIADGKRSLELHAAPNTLWRTSSLTHPFYLEIQSKQSSYAKDALFDSLYRASEDGHLVAPLYADFWTQGSLEPKVTEAEQETILTTEMSSYDLTQNPKVNFLPFTLDVYGWSRAGDTTDIVNGGGDEPSNPNALNAEVWVKLKVKRGETDLDVECKNYTSIYNRWPRTWLTSADGSYPVTIECRSSDGLQVGDEILAVSVVLKNPNPSDKILSVVERVQSDDILMYLATHDAAWKEIEVSSGAISSWHFEAAGSTLEWVPQNAGLAGDPAASYGWNYAIGCFHSGLQIDVTTPSGANTVPDGCGNSGPNWPATGAGAMIYNYPNGTNVFGTESSSANVEYSILYRRWPTGGGMNGRLFIGLVFSDNSTKIVEVAGSSGETSIEHATKTITFDGIAGKQVKAVRFVGSGRGFLVRLHSLELHGFTMPPLETTKMQELQRIGVPVIYFATKPYNTFNFEVAAKLELSGTGAWGGVVGLAKDSLNYLAARASTDVVQLLMVRNGTVSILKEEEATHLDTFWILFEHRDGRLTIRLRDTNQWRQALQYDWEEDNGPMAVDADLLHVGIYALRETPWVRITGFDSENTTILGVLPGSDMEQFPSDGILNIGGQRYRYTGKLVSENIIRGPFQARNTGLGWNYTEDGHSYSGNSVEFTLFEHISNSENFDKYANRIMAFDNGFAWKILSTDYKSWTKTGGKRIYLRNRSRHFGEGVSGDHVGMNHRVWVTDGFTGVTLHEGEPQLHDAGEIASLDDNSRVRLLQFAASSGHEDCTVEDMLAKVVQLAGGQSVFPGDRRVALKTLTPTAWRLA